jgi:hypothetical protein
MSFALTINQIRKRTKTVTRRLGWSELRPGILFRAVEKVQGLKRGEKVKRLALLRCVESSCEELRVITPADVAREGFPGLSAAAFVQMFCLHMRCKPDQLVNRIRFEYVDESEAAP